MAQVFVSGTWRAERAAPYTAVAHRIGERIGLAGFDLACGPGTGIARPTIDGFRTVDPRGQVRYYLPRAELMSDVGETVEDGWDELLQTDHDYPMRNVWQVAQSDGLLVLTGGDGALEEILPALIDYGLPVGILRNSGPAAIAIERLVDLFPEWEQLLLITDDLESIFDQFAERVRARAALTPPAAG